MKKLFAIIVVAILGAGVAFAHNSGEHGSKEGLLGLKPEYIHVLLNPLLGYGLGTGIIILGFGLLMRNKTTRTVGLIVTAVCAASAWPVLYFGQHGYNSLSPLLDSESHQWLDVHMERAERFIYVFYATAVLAMVALVLSKKPKVSVALAVLTLAIGGCALGIGAWIARAGGQISHSEFREEGMSPPSAPQTAHEHGGKKMQMTNEGGHNHEITSEHAAAETPLPDTIEGVWKAIHEHQGELESSVNTNRFKDVLSHAAMMSDLAKKLVELAHPDHKAAVESGVNKITHALDELKSSAETGSEAIMRTHYKESKDSLQQLEEQMNKQ
ncbi:MAG: hypothetical protein M3Y82_04760 [Verrucomicrobiota bacterium]|nr:hypothetical protein [Verrucomicrobiota bacterium]